jgi:hypothetical protein
LGDRASVGAREASRRLNVLGRAVGGLAGRRKAGSEFGGLGKRLRDVRARLGTHDPAIMFGAVHNQTLLGIGDDR